MNDGDYVIDSAGFEFDTNGKLVLRMTGHETPESILDRWIESLNHYVSTGSPMTLSATRTTNLRDLLTTVRDYIYRTLPDDVDLPMPNDIWEMAWQAWLTRHETTEGEPVQERRQYEECRACGYIMFDRDAGVCDNCGSWGR